MASDEQSSDRPRQPTSSRARPGRRPGRPSGQSNSREIILETALTQFASDGYSATSIRSIAGAAGVDPSLVTHFFRNKEGLLVEMLKHLDHLPARIQTVLASGTPGAGQRLAITYFSAWEDPALGPRLCALARAVAESPSAAAMIRSTLKSQIFVPLAKRSPKPWSPERLVSMQIAMSQLFGTAFARYVLQIQPLSDYNLSELIAHVEPGLSTTLSWDGVNDT